MANFEAFRWNFSSNTNPGIGRSVCVPCSRQVVFVNQFPLMKGLSLEGALVRGGNGLHFFKEFLKVLGDNLEKIYFLLINY